MMWLTWRQHRKQILFALAGLAALIALMVPTGRQMHRTFMNTGLADCLNQLGHSEFIVLDRHTGCGPQLDQFNTQYQTYALLGVLFVFLPLLVGLFFGAPLVAREVEHGTHRLVWTQSIGRLRWATTKLGLVGGFALALAGAYALLLTWWLGPLGRANFGRFFWLFFDVQAVVPVAYTLFAVALGTFAGTVWHRTLSAMAVTLVGFLGLRVAVAILARPHFLPAQRRTYLVSGTQQPNPARQDWVMSQGIYDSHGRLVAGSQEAFCGSQPIDLPTVSPSTPAPTASFEDDQCAHFGLGAYNAQAYQPEGRFWLFQYLEAGLFLTIAAVLLCLAVRQMSVSRSSWNLGGGPPPESCLVVGLG
jgi:hypothetical protein